MVAVVSQSVSSPVQGRVGLNLIPPLLSFSTLFKRKRQRLIVSLSKFGNRGLTID